MSTCVDNDGATPQLQEVFNQNPNLPPGITVGRLNNNDIFCLDNEESGQVCYKDIPGVHRALAAFNLNDYESPNNDKEKKEEVVPLTVDDMDKLVPGMWLKCLYDINDASYYEAMFLTSNAADQMNPNVDGISIMGHNTNTIGIEYDRHELDEGEEAQKVVPISWCMPNGYEVYEAADSQVDYIIEETVEKLFHRAFKELSNNQRLKLDTKVLFSYSQHETVTKDKDGYIKKSGRTTPIPVEMDISQYKTIYSALTFSHPAVQQIDNKLKLYQLYKDDPMASKVFPKSYSSYKEALQDTEETGEDIFYIKKAEGTRGEGIYVKTREELVADYYELKEGGEYNVDEGEGDVIIQRAVKDLYTIGGDGAIGGRRFDIRYYVVITDGKVYLHSNMVFSWALGVKYNPNDSNIDNQVVKQYTYTQGMIIPVFIEPLPKDAFGNAWNNSERKRRAPTTSSDEYRPSNIHGWRDAVADALDDASGVFDNLKEITRGDPTKYALVGGDAMIKEDGSAINVEFNVWPDLAFPYSGLTKCLGGEGCSSMYLETPDADHNYILTQPTIASDITSTGGNAEVVRDMISMVMKLQPADEIEGLREIVVRDE